MDVISWRLLARLGLLLLSVCAWVAVAACSSGGGGKLMQDGGSMDTVVLDFGFGELPAGCPPGVANDKGVGASCTENGAQCGAGLACTCDTIFSLKGPPGTPCFCSIAFLQPCSGAPAGTCGQNASCCSYMGIASLCVPNVCLVSAMCPLFAPAP
jgi:hypothetical protein